ncbi:hypothetical protein TDB9533_04476 [Thalassocella blandensis]|nr:hypothetical protein TDB9533_04476 [Thalassocella blandensis]
MFLNKNTLSQAIVTCVMTGTLISCGGGGNSSSATTSPTPTASPTPSPTPQANQSPTVFLGEDLHANEGTSVTLTGTASDADGTIEAIAWRQLDGVNVQISSPNLLSTSVVLPLVDQAEKVTLALSVTDNDGNVTEAFIAINIMPENTLPSAQAGNAIEVAPGDEFTLDASASSDEDGTIEQYEWLLNGEVVSTKVQFTTSISKAGSFIYTLRITDNDGGIANDTVSVEVKDSPDNSFKADFAITVSDTTPIATYLDCGDFNAAKLDLSAAALSLSSFKQNLAAKEKERDDIAAEKSALEVILSELEEEKTTLSTKLTQMQTELTALEAETESKATSYEECLATLEELACETELQAYIEARAAERNKRNALNDTKLSLNTVATDISDNERRHQSLLEDEAANAAFFVNYENALSTLNAAVSKLTDFIGRDAARYHLEFDGVLEQTEDQQVYHARVVRANAANNIALLQTPGITKFEHDLLHPVGGNHSFQWNDLWQEEMPGKPQSGTALHNFLNAGTEVDLSIDYPNYCAAGFSTTKQALFDLDSLYMEMFVTSPVSMDNQYQISVNVQDTLHALTTRASDTHFLSETELQSLVDSDVPGYSIQTIHLENEVEIAPIEAALKADYLNRVLSTYAVPSVKKNMQSDCNTDSNRWCNYYGWWLLASDSPINAGTLIETVAKEYTVKESTHIRDSIFVPIQNKTLDE